MNLRTCLRNAQTILNLLGCNNSVTLYTIVQLIILYSRNVNTVEGLRKNKACRVTSKFIENNYEYVNKKSYIELNSFIYLLWLDIQRIFEGFPNTVGFRCVDDCYWNLIRQFRSNSIQIKSNEKGKYVYVLCFVYKKLFSGFLLIYIEIKSKI